MDVHVISETTKTITLGWTPVAGSKGYVYYVDGVRKSNTWDPDTNQVKFGKPDSNTHTYAVIALNVEDDGYVNHPSPKPPPPPPPPPSGIQKPFGVDKMGNSYSMASGYDRYGLVCAGIGEADLVGALPSTTKKLVYMDFFEATSWFTGVTLPVNPAYVLTTETGTYAGVKLLDPAAPGLAEELITNIGNFLRAHKLDGFYTDNCVACPATFSATIPAKYSNPSDWYTAVSQLVLKVGGALKQQGFYVGANMIAYFPGNVGVFPGTDSNNGSSLAAWIKMCAPGLSWVMIEEWMWSNGHLRNTNLQWDDQWNGYQSLVRVAQDAGCDFVGLIQEPHGQAARVYTQASYLLDKDDNRTGGCMVDGGGDVFSTTWCKPVGAAKGAKVKSGNLWTRKFDNGSGGTVTVTVDPVAATASIV